MRICSLLPSATEIVYALGLGGHLVGVTHECDHPVEARRLPMITSSVIDHAGSTSGEIHNHVQSSIHQGSSIYHLDQDLLKRINPDLILTQELCEVCAVSYGEVRRAARIMDGDRKVVSLEPTSLGGMLDTIAMVGELTGTQGKAKQVIDGLRERIEGVADLTSHVVSRPRVLALEWLDPPFTGGHWVPEMVRLAGGTDGLGEERSPSTIKAWDGIFAYDPEVAVLTPCGFDLPRTVREASRQAFPSGWAGMTAVRQGRVYAVDGSAYFARPGPRLVDGLEILAEILHPELFPRVKPADAWCLLNG